ncbi:hypothetical protein TNCV_1670251 [Trichonephila clavipes]|nr:hypothetical protein TNCV_1670251 [Trichonephila clavipes]
MSRRKQRSTFDQVSELDRERIVAYRDIVHYLSAKSIVMLDETKQLYCEYVTVGYGRVRWTDVVNRVHFTAPLHVRTAKLCAVMDRSVTSRTVAQHIES